VNDDFLSKLREEPSPEFTERLEHRLRAIDEERATSLRRVPRRLSPLLSAAAVIAVVAAIVGLPPVRGAARGFLDLFRVKRFAAVPVDPERVARLQEGRLDLKAIVGEQVEVLEPAVEPELVASPEAAAELAGFRLKQPVTLPRDTTLVETRLARPGAFRLTLDAAKLQELARLMGARDVEVPPEWDGARVEVKATPVVALTYRRGSDEFVLLEARSPAVELPPGVDLTRLGQIGLEMAGLSPEEARIFARTIDWRSTLLVPVPAEEASFREVEVGGGRGLLVTSRQRPKAATRGGSRWRSVLLWSAGGLVFGIDGPGNGIEILLMAQSMG
jgi:hypothetical protein